MKKFVGIILFVFVLISFCFAEDLKNIKEIENIRHKDKEYLVVLYYKEDIVVFSDIIEGERNDVSFYPSPILRKGIEFSIDKILFVHNHPANHKFIMESEKDIKVKKACQIIFDREKIKTQYIIVTDCCQKEY